MYLFELVVEGTCLGIHVDLIHTRMCYVHLYCLPTCSTTGVPVPRIPPRPVLPYYLFNRSKLPALFQRGCDAALCDAALVPAAIFTRTLLGRPLDWNRCVYSSGNIKDFQCLWQIICFGGKGIMIPIYYAVKRTLFRSVILMFQHSRTWWCSLLQDDAVDPNR